MHYFGLLSLVVAVAVMGWWFTAAVPAHAPEKEEVATETPIDPAVAAAIEAKADLVTVSQPRAQSSVSDPLIIKGEARGYWFFEGSFPVMLTDWDGRIIAEHFATAETDWMTKDFVPFTAALDFESPYRAGDPDFMRRGSLILKRDNPSGLPENDDALEIPILFVAPTSAASVRADATYGESLDAARDAARLLSQ